MGKHVEDLVAVYAGSLPTLKPLLTAWTQVVLRYCDNEGYCDNPWWFNERATLSTLAAAAWTLDGWAALEEFNTRKRGGIVPKDRTDEGSRHGRCDLYVSHKRGHSYAIEAKQAWQAIGNDADAEATNLMMAAAWDDVGKLDKEEAKRRLAVTFVIPFLAKKIANVPNAGIEHTRSVVDDWLRTNPIDALDRTPHAYAWVFPGNTAEFYNGKSGRVFPGVLMLIEERLRAQRRTAER